MKPPSPGLPIWVTILVAILGIIGIVAGQFINAWREDRRWKREQQREEIRWKREYQKESAKLRQDHITQWRETRIRIYSEYITALETIETTSEKIIKSASNTEREELRGVLRQQIKNLGSVTAQVELVTSSSEQMLMPRELFSLVIATLRFPDAPSTPDDVRAQRDIEHAKAEGKQLRHAVDSIACQKVVVIEAMRKELGVAPVDIQDSKERC